MSGVHENGGPGGKHPPHEGAHSHDEAHHSHEGEPHSHDDGHHAHEGEAHSHDDEHHAHEGEMHSHDDEHHAHEGEMHSHDDEHHAHEGEMHSHDDEHHSPGGPVPPPAPGPIAQSVAIGFRAVYAAMLLLAVLWLGSNFRQIAPDTQAVVLRLGRVVRTQQAGLLLAWPRPIEEVRLLPGPERQLSQDVSAVQPESNKALAVITANDGSLPKNISAFLTGDGNVVLLNATLIYRISDPVGYALAESHVPAALDRLFRATTVRVTAGSNLNDFLVVTNSGSNVAGAGAGTGAGAGVAAPGRGAIALRSEVRSVLLETVNSRLRQLAQAGSPLGIEVQRIDMTAWLPPEAKVAFDAVLTATQAADRGVAVARTDAERRRQESDREKDRLLAAAHATAQELLSTAAVDTARIVALEHEETPETRNSILLREYRSGIAGVMDRAGSATVIDPQSGVRFVLPGRTK